MGYEGVPILNRLLTAIVLATFWCLLPAQLGCERTASHPPAGQLAEGEKSPLRDPISTDSAAEDFGADTRKTSLAELLIDAGSPQNLGVAPENTTDPVATVTTANTTEPSPVNGGGTHPRISSADRQPAEPDSTTNLEPPRFETVAPLTGSEESGLRTLRGRYLTLVTDVPSSPAINELTLVFDRAVAQWSRYFHTSPADIENFLMTGYVIRSKERFLANGLLPSDLPPFLHGYQRGESFWVYEQPSDYYLRHLMLHEGTHAFMKRILGGAGPPWFMEGVADHLATHHWDGGVLQLGYMPQSRDEVPYWGRIKAIKDDFAAGKALMIPQVMRLDAREFLKVDAYAWCWALAAFLDGHPVFRDRFQALRNDVADNTSRFTRNFEFQLLNDLRELDEEWQLFVSTIEYGYDFERSAVVRNPGRPLPVDGATASIRTDRGWQSAGYRLEPGRTYRIQASGRYQIQQEPESWWCEPGGITLRYYQGQPLGKLVGNVRFDEARPGLANLVQPLAIGRGRTIQPEYGGTLYLKINDSPAELSDNEGELTVRIIPL